MTRLLFICSGNICRSPTAEGVMRHLVALRGLQGQIEVDSAGIGAWHVGEAPDQRSTAVAARRGITLDGAARQVRARDFDEFDLLLCADRTHVRDLHRLAPDEETAAKIRLLREFDPASDGDLDVPDPYYGGASGFDHVLDLIAAACDGLLDDIA